jgi:hypothetical protein
MVEHEPVRPLRKHVAAMLPDPLLVRGHLAPIEYANRRSRITRH